MTRMPEDEPGRSSDSEVVPPAPPSPWSAWLDRVLALRPGLLAAVLLYAALDRGLDTLAACVGALAGK